MATQKVITSNAVKNDGATVLWGGGASNRVVSNRPSYDKIGVHSRQGSKPAFDSLRGENPTVKSGATTAKEGSAFGEQRYGQYIMRSYSGLKVIGSASTVLNGGSNFGRRSIHKNEHARTRKIVTAGWNYITGAPLTTPTVTNDSFGTDDAASPTRAVPGEMVYKTGAKLPKMDDYKAKTG